MLTMRLAQADTHCIKSMAFETCGNGRVNTTEIEIQIDEQDHVFKRAPKNKFVSHRYEHMLQAAGDNSY